MSAIPRQQRRWLFSVYRRTPDGVVHETIEVVAADSFSAWAELPDDVVSWDFHQYPDGAYSQPLTEEAA